jgi:cerevisin
LQGFSIFNVPGSSLRGYVSSFSPESLEAVRLSPAVDFVEEDQIVHTLAPVKSDGELEEDAPWGLARVAHRTHPNGTEAHHYAYRGNAGKHVVVYIVDTVSPSLISQGVNIHHDEFEGRAVWGKTIPFGDEDKDGNGHGTRMFPSSNLSSRRRRNRCWKDVWYCQESQDCRRKGLFFST